jgi:hypothetical protein
LEVTQTTGRRLWGVILFIKYDKLDSACTTQGSDEKWIGSFCYESLKGKASWKIWTYTGVCRISGTEDGDWVYLDQRRICEHGTQLSGSMKGEEFQCQC